MAVVASLPQQSYTPRTLTANPTIGAGVKRMVLTCTRVSWPVGSIGTISVTMPDGSAGPQCGFAGGAALQKDGVTPALVSGMTMEGQQGADFPVGTYTVQIVILQTVTTAVTVESF